MDYLDKEGLRYLIEKILTELRQTQSAAVATDENSDTDSGKENA